MSDIRKRTGKKGTTYQVRYNNPRSKTGVSYKTFDTKKEARAFLESGEAKIAATLSGYRYTVPEAVEQWLKICEKEGLNGRDPVTVYTLKNYRYFSEIMTAYSWPKRLAEIEPPDVIAFRSWLLNNHSRYLARKSLSLIQSVFKEMVIRGHAPTNPAAGITVSSTSRYDQPVTPPSLEEFYQLLNAADRLANSKNAQIAGAWERFRPMLYLAGDTGMRPGEYMALPIFNVSPTEVKVDRAVERGGHRISVTKTPAGWRWIDLSPEVADMVLHYATHHAVPNKYDLVFPTSGGRWQCINNWRNRPFTKACFEAGLVVEIEKNGKKIEKPKYSPYDLRHFYASMLIEQNVSLKRIQKLMGHTNIATTLNVYGHIIERAEMAQEKATGLLGRISQEGCGKNVANPRYPAVSKT
jgi:integrase